MCPINMICYSIDLYNKIYKINSMSHQNGQQNGAKIFGLHRYNPFLDCRKARSRS